VTGVAVLLPVLNRPERAQIVVDSIRDADDRAQPVFLCSPGDDAEIAAVNATGVPAIVVPWPPGHGDWAKKINLAFRLLAHEWFLFGADDLRFHAGWLEACLQQHVRSSACVIGTNDMGNARVLAGHHSTHPLVHRDYLECGTADDDGIVLHEGYIHQFTDDEFVQTALVRRTFSFARTAYVEHLHPHWGKGQDDETYRLGNAGFAQDQLLYNQRKHLWLS
jgi:hypothetical protein